MIDEIDLSQRHLKFGYGKELRIDSLGNSYHVDCIQHCLPYAFGQCSQLHLETCAECKKLENLFATLVTLLPEETVILSENRKKLQYYWSHQARKTYLNAQFNAAILTLDKDGAIVVVDYKMRVLPKSAREIKSEFFGKKGWTLHTMLVYGKEDDSDKINIQAFDHWSSDTTQDAWFTASAFDAVFNTLKKKPSWIKVLSDNGAHYHCSELMTTISNWKEWYNVEVRQWIFLEPGEAKTTIDSHHAQACIIFFLFLKITLPLMTP